MFHKGLMDRFNFGGKSPEVTPDAGQTKGPNWAKMSDQDFETNMLRKTTAGGLDLDNMGPDEKERWIQYIMAQQSKGDQFAAQGQSQRQAQSSQVPAAPLTSIQGLMSMVGQPQTAKKVAPRMGLMGAGRFK